MTAVGLADELMTVMACLRRRVRRRLRDEMPEPRLRGAQVELLRVVEEQPGIGVVAAARELHMAGNSVSTLVNQLVDAGMLHRETDPRDRRAACLWLTPAAQQRLDGWRAARVRLVTSGLAELDGAEVEALTRALPALRALLGALADSDEGLIP